MSESASHYSENEALFTQSVATEKEGLDFSEEASPETYAEVERLVEQLRDRKFDFLNIDWDTFDPANPQVLATKLEVASEILGFPDTKTKKKSSNQAFNFVMAATAFLAGCTAVSSSIIANKYEAAHEIKLAEAQSDTSVVLPGEGWADDQRIELKEWKDQHPEVTKVIIGQPEVHNESENIYKMPVTFILDNGPTVVTEGKMRLATNALRGTIEEMDGPQLAARRALEYLGVSGAMNYFESHQGREY